MKICLKSIISLQNSKVTLKVQRINGPEEAILNEQRYIMSRGGHETHNDQPGHDESQEDIGCDVEFGAPVAG